MPPKVEIYQENTMRSGINRRRVYATVHQPTAQIGSIVADLYINRCSLYHHLRKQPHLESHMNNLYTHC